MLVRGEISGYRTTYSSGHAYFSLKDSQSRIDAVIWKGTLKRIKLSPKEGMEYIVQGKMTTFPGSSKYQIIVEALIPYGAGAIMTILEERKRKLREEGLFSNERKRPMPFIPKTIAVITSPTGAVIRDILQRISCRFPMRVIVFPVKVQGDGCSQEIKNAILQLNSLKEEDICPKPDIIIIARGGGSLEDLWHFNDEEMVRTVANSSIRIISAIGHETDWTLVDYAADLRAPTPTGAAEMAVPVKSQLKSLLASLENRSKESLIRFINNKINQFKTLVKAIPKYTQIISLYHHSIEQLSHELEIYLKTNTFRKRRDFDNKNTNIISYYPINYIKNNRHHIIKAQQNIEHLTEKHLRYIQLKTTKKYTTINILYEQTKIRIKYFKTYINELLNRAEFTMSYKIKNCHECISADNRILQSLSHSSTLKRGYSIIRSRTNNNIITKTSKLSVGESIFINLFDGQANAIITNNSCLPKHKKTPSKRKYNHRKHKTISK
ncbi:exodeoxyribonuclease VII large subunit [Candidatus Liberibacter americanus]|uniref:exodeoxyribonuclease VII large subunit n=1 Tax=Candidatus Liberibacter americanus TaxID=309868 RepID=UPI001F0AF8E1